MSDIANHSVSIPVGDGEMSGYLAIPLQNPSTTAVLILVELWGLTPHMRNVSDRLAQAGYPALALDLFRGTTPPSPDDPLPKWAETFEAFDDRRCIRDCRRALHWLQSGQAGVEIDAVFPWGFCMGGRFAHHLGAFSDRVAGIINFYGRLDFPRGENKPFTPLDVASIIDVPYLGLFAETDNLISADDVAELRRRLSHNPATDIRIVAGTEHAFFNDERPAYHPAMAQMSWQQVLAFMAKYG